MTNTVMLQEQNTMPGFTSKDSYQLLWNMAKMFSETTLIPESFRKNVGNCAIAINMAQRLKADPLMVMQNLYVVYGNPSWSSKFLISVFNQCGKYTSIKYKYVGDKNTDDYGCIAYTTEIATGDKIEGPLVTIGLAKAEGWFAKKGSKWQTIPDLMLRYRAAAWLIRTTAPELSMGLQTQEEIYDTHEKDITEEAKPVQEIKEKMASKTLEMPKQEPKSEVLDKINKAEAKAKETVQTKPVKKEEPKKVKVEQPAFDEQEDDEEQPPF